MKKDNSDLKKHWKTAISNRIHLKKDNSGKGHLKKTILNGINMKMNTSEKEEYEKDSFGKGKSEKG